MSSTISNIIHEPLSWLLIGMITTLIIMFGFVAPYLDESEYNKDISKIPDIKSCFELSKMDRSIVIDHWSKYRDLVENAINQKAVDLKC